MAGVTAPLRSQRDAMLLGSASFLERLKAEARAVAAGPQPKPDVELSSLPTSPASPGSPLSPGAEAGAAAAVTAAIQQQQQQQQGAAAGATAPPDPAPPSYAYRHAFDVAGCSASVCKWAHGSADVLAWGAADGAVYVATVEAPPRLLQVLECHRERVADLDWSPDGTLLLSCSADGTACLWRADSGALVRTFRNATGPLGCCRFLPDNPNLLLLGTAAGELLAINASTGRAVARAELQAAPMSGVGACCLEAAGDGHLLIADSRGCLHLYAASLAGGQLSSLRQAAYFSAVGSRFHEPACLQYMQYSQLAGGPAVLLALSSGEVSLCRLQEKPWRLEVRRELRIGCASAKVRASLRPGAARGLPDLLLAGSEDCIVQMLDIRQSAPRLVAALERHAAPVLSAAWSEDESRVASCDKRGVVVVWEARPPAAAADDGRSAPLPRSRSV